MEDRAATAKVYKLQYLSNECHFLILHENCGPPQSSMSRGICLESKREENDKVKENLQPVAPSWYKTLSLIELEHGCLK